MLLPMNLQLFAEDEPIDQSIDTGGTGDTGIEEEEYDLGFDDSNYEDDVEPEPETNLEPEPEPQTQPKGQPNDLARRVRTATEMELKKQFENSPEYQIAKRLGAMYGRTPEQMLKDLEQKELQQKAEKQQVPVEVLQKIQQIEHQNESVLRQYYQLQVETQVEQLKKEFPDFNDQDPNFWQFAQQHPSLPLRDAYRLMNFDNIINSKTRQVEQQTLGNVQKRNLQSPTKGATPRTNNSRGAWDMNDKDFDDLLSRVKSGEEITSL